MIRCRDGWCWFCWRELEEAPLPARLRVLCAWDRHGVRGVLVFTPQRLLSLPEGWRGEPWAGWAADDGRVFLALPLGLVVEADAARVAADSAG